MISSDDEALAQRWYDRKSALMEASLGKEHDVVMHAIIPFAVGGGLDLYYYPNGLPGTAIATKELCELPARFVIHTVGPVWRGGGHGEAELLASCHRRALEVAQELGARTVAFPAISCGVYGYPPEQAAGVALAAVRGHDLELVRFVLFGDETYDAFARAAAA